jgi:pilus assembly protein FimV
MADSAQKFIGRNRAPRVQIEYDVELYGAQKKVQLPFVMGVLSDLAGKSGVAQPAVEDRRFLEIDVDNFDDRMQAMQPRVAFSVANTLTGEGNLAVDLTFAEMDDFSPGAIAAGIAALRPLLEARAQLSDLMAYMDGKSGAEALIEKILANPALLSVIATAAPGGMDPDAVENDGTGDVLEALKAQAAPETGDVDTTGDVLSALGQRAPTPEVEAEENAGILDDLRRAAPGEPIAEEGDDLGALLADLADAPGEVAETSDDTAAALDGLAQVEIADTGADDLGALLADLADAPGEASDDLDDLDDLLAGPDAAAEAAKPEDDAGGDQDVSPENSAGGTGRGAATMSDEPEFAFGRLDAKRSDPARLNRGRFRLAILGDFSGRAARGQLETGAALARRRAISLDPDTVADAIEGFATDLVLPIGRDGAGVAVKLGGLDDLHPDELYENVDIFAELVALRGQLNSGATAENAARQLRDWGAAHAIPVAPAQRRSGGNAVPADRRLSEFQRLIGDSGARVRQASPLQDMLARIVGPHIRAVPDADTQAMQKALEDALSSAMRLVLHHPDFQSIEAQWRSLDLIARSIETDDTLDVVLYDVSAEEIAADLAVSDDLAQSGFARLLTGAPLDEEHGRGGYSALIGLYSFEETPPHAALLGRIARVAAHVDAPFFTAISPAFMATEKADRHPLVASAWDALRAMPEAGHLGIVSPRFLLRRPYGAKSEPIYEFAFEEFTMSEGLRGMLWANPAVLVAILLAKSFRSHGAGMNLGAIMSLGDMPYHFVNDCYGDQVALPCTERNLTLETVEKVMARGFMPVVSIKGRDEIRLASFQSLAGAEISGPWSSVAPPPPSPPVPQVPQAQEAAAASETPSEDDVDLDELLAGFVDDATDEAVDPGDLDAELAALLEDL